jgi:hypothetical protein
LSFQQSRRITDSGPTAHGPIAIVYQRGKMNEWLNLSIYGPASDARNGRQPRGRFCDSGKLELNQSSPGWTSPAAFNIFSVMMRVIFALIVLVGCSPADPGPPVPITFSTGVCEGTCPAWEATVTEAGGVYRGGQFSRVIGERQFALTPEQYREIALALAPIRAKGEQSLYPGGPGCEHAPTDMPTIHVSWGDQDRLMFYSGCQGPKNARIRDALLKTEQLLLTSSVAGWAMSAVHSLRDP